jgi:hypothetical protein
MGRGGTSSFNETDVERFSLSGANDLPAVPLINFLITLKVEMPYDEDSDIDDDYSTFEDLLWEAFENDGGEWEGLSVLKMPAEDYVEAWVEDISKAQAIARYKAIIARYPSLPKVLKFEIEEA